MLGSRDSEDPINVVQVLEGLWACARGEDGAQEEGSPAWSREVLLGLQAAAKLLLSL